MTDFLDVVEPNLSAAVKSVEAKFDEGWAFTDASVAFDFKSYQQIHLHKAEGLRPKVDHGDVVSVAVVAYDINDLIRQVQDAYLQGFRFLFDASVPGVYYSVNMVRKDYKEQIDVPSETPAVVEVTEVVVEEAAKPARKQRAKKAE